MKGKPRSKKTQEIRLDKKPSTQQELAGKLKPEMDPIKFQKEQRGNW